MRILPGKNRTDHRVTLDRLRLDAFEGRLLVGPPKTTRSRKIEGIDFERIHVRLNVATSEGGRGRQDGRGRIADQGEQRVAGAWVGWGQCIPAPAVTALVCLGALGFWGSYFYVGRRLRGTGL